MKSSLSISLLFITLTLVSCGSATKSSAVIPIDLTDEVMISNGDFDLTIYQIEPIESKKLGGRQISLNDDAKEEYGLYEIRMRYTNLTDEETILSYRQLWVSLPDVEDPGESLFVVGYCEPEADYPTANPTWCAYLPPPPEPGKYGVVGVFHTPSPSIQPGEQARFNFIILVEKAQTELEISFVEPE